MAGGWFNNISSSISSLQSRIIEVRFNDKVEQRTYDPKNPPNIFDSLSTSFINLFKTQQEQEEHLILAKCGFYKYDDNGDRIKSTKNPSNFTDALIKFDENDSSDNIKKSLSAIFDAYYGQQE